MQIIPQVAAMPRPIYPRLGSSTNNRHVGGFDMVEEMNYLYIKIVKAKDLSGGDSHHSEYDPFIEVRLGNYSVRAPHQVEWNRTFAIPRERVQVSTIEVCVISNNNSASEGNGVKGKVSFVVDNIPKRVPPDSPLAPQWYVLEDAYNNGGIIPRGELMLGVWVGTQADKEFHNAWHSEGVGDTRGITYNLPKLYYVRVNVMQVRSLERNKTSEVFVRVRTKCGVDRTRNSVVRNRGDAIWHEDLMFVAADKDSDSDAVLLTVEERVGNTDEVIGVCKIPLSVVHSRPTDAPVEPRWHALCIVQGANDSNNTRVSTGQILLRVSKDVGYNVAYEAASCISDTRPADRRLWNPRLGSLELGILNANSMRMRAETGMPGSYYCVAKYGKKWGRTRTVMNNSEPKWNEQYTWDVFDPCTVLTIGVFDNYQGQKLDAGMGIIGIPVSTLEAGKIYAYSHPLLVLQPQGLQKTGDLLITYRFSYCTTSSFNLLQLYTLPILPIMHYIHPLSLRQQANSRIQAIRHICGSLSASDPPLRKEVVEYLLDDSGSQLFSVRRALACNRRFNDVIVSSLYSIKTLTDEICSWKTSWLTVLVQLILIFLVFFPQVIIPGICTSLVLLGAWNYRTRPKTPPHIDCRLTCLDQILPPDLEEEFDSRTDPTACNDIVALSFRYNRMRPIASRVQTMFGDFVGHLERLQSLVNWRDRRATALFMVFCVVAAFFFFIIPLRAVFLGSVCYILRPPQFRSKLPFRAVNFFRRLPSRTYSLL